MNMARRRIASFARWLPKASPKLTWTWAHQKLLYQKLEKVTKGEIDRLMIFMPPRHSKSETVTVHYITYRLKADPKLNVILGCYNQRLANRFSRRIRKLAGEQKIALSRERRSVEEWETARGGGVRAVGVGAGITGYGARLVVIDDPVKNRAQAESQTFRDNAWNWFNDDIYTRFEPGAAVILIQTRWHEDDLAGRLLRAMRDGGDKWEVLSLPALAESDDPLGRSKGEPLCPERFDKAALKRIRRKLGSYSFSALYQQNPVPFEGGLFKRKWFRRIVSRPPAGLHWVRGYDLAVSTRDTADYTASFRVALDPKTGDLYIADGFRGRLEFPDQRRYIARCIAGERDTRHCIESALHGRAFVQELQREVRFAGRSIRAVRVDEDKVTRAHSWTARAEAGKVVLVAGEWIEEFLDEVCRFPRGRFDDQVDAVSLAVAALARDARNYSPGSGAWGF